MQKSDISIGALVEMYKRGELRLPEIQRQYVWQSTRVRDLFDSLYRGYPSGSILMWETDEIVPTRESAIQTTHSVFAGRKLLLDGQQRLTSLAAVLNGEPVIVRGKKRPIEILFNLDHPDGPPVEVTEVEGDEVSVIIPYDEIVDDETNDDDLKNGLAERFSQRTFIVSSKNIASLPNWISVSKVFTSQTDADFLRKAGITSYEDPRGQKYSERIARLRAIKNYMYVVHVLERTMSYEEVTEIFVRVNSLGAKLKSSDLALAQITSRWQNLLQHFEEFQDECEQSWFTLDFGLLVRTLVVMATKQCFFKTVSTTHLDKLKNGWEMAKEGLRFAINFLRTNAGIEDESLLSSPFLMVTLAVISRVKDNRLTIDEQRALMRWLLIANARGRYSRGSSETLLNEDLSILFKTNSIQNLMDPLTRQFGRLTIEPEDLVSRGVNSPLFSLTYLALKDAGAKDWISGLGLSLTHQGKMHFIQWHHIFPKSKLKERREFETGEINEIANMAFISGQTNRRLGNRLPEEYLPEIIEKQGESALTSQLVTTDTQLWKIDSYRNFLEQRRKLLADTMNRFIDKMSTTSGKILE